MATQGHVITKTIKNFQLFDISPGNTFSMIEIKILVKYTECVKHNKGTGEHQLTLSF